jgi:hypothetical protein
MKSRYLIAMIMLAECFMYNSTSLAKTTKSSKRAQSQKKSTKKTKKSTKANNIFYICDIIENGINKFKIQDNEEDFVRKCSCIGTCTFIMQEGDSSTG